MTEQPTILVDHADSVSTITFNRPAQLNALDPDMVEEFQSIVRAAGIDVFVRMPRGDDIDAACGQLAAKRAPSETSSGLTQIGTGKPPV